MGRKSPYQKPKRIKVGRYRYVVGKDNKPIVGLSWDKANGQYYPTDWKKLELKKRPNFGTECDTAIFNFRQWKSRLQTNMTTFVGLTEEDFELGEDTHVVYTSKEVADLHRIAADLGVEPHKYTVGEKHRIYWTYDLQLVEDKFFAKLRDMMINDIEGVRKKLNLYIEVKDAAALRKAYTLKQIGDHFFGLLKYQNPEKRSQKNELKELKKTWQMFCEIIGVKTAGEVAKQHINRFHDYVMRKAKKKSWSTSTIRKYFEHPRRIINAAIEDFDNAHDIEDLKKKCLAKLKIPPQVIENKLKLIQKMDFKRLLEVSNLEETAMWLLSMNGAYYAIDIVMVPLKAIDWQDNTIVFRRTKTEKQGKGHRSMVMWEKTIRAIKAYMEAKPHNGETLFYNNRDSKPYNRDWITEKFRDCLDKAKIVDNKGNRKYSHQNFRDSVETIGYQQGHVIQNSVDAVLGHKPSGSKRNYIDPEKFPQISEACCKAVYRHYFGKEHPPPNSSIK